MAHRRSSTGIYLEDAIRAGIPVNEEINPDETTVAFVSVASEGIFVEQTIALAKKVIQAGGAVVMDRSGTGFGQSHSRLTGTGKAGCRMRLENRQGKPGKGITFLGMSSWLKGNNPAGKQYEKKSQAF